MTAPADDHRVSPGRRTALASAAALRSLTLLGVLVVGLATGLRIVDELPALVAGVSRGARRLPSVEAIARASSLRMPLPAFFPDTIEWPPSDVLVFGPASASLAFRLRRSRETGLYIAASAGQPNVPRQLLPAAEPFQSEPTTIGGRPATASRVRDGNGAVWNQLAWTANGGARLVRYRGTLDELLLIAGSMGERGK